MLLDKTFWSEQPRTALVQVDELHITYLCATFNYLEDFVDNYCYYFLIFLGGGQGSGIFIFLFFLCLSYRKQGKKGGTGKSNTKFKHGRWIHRNTSQVCMWIITNSWWFMKTGTNHHQILLLWIKGNSRLQKPLLLGSVWVPLSTLSMWYIFVNEYNTCLTFI